MNLYEKLANAIIIQAARDYRKALTKLLKRPNNIQAMRTAIECEQFFSSRWYKDLTSIDGEYLMNRIREEVKNGC